MHLLVTIDLVSCNRRGQNSGKRGRQRGGGRGEGGEGRENERGERERERERESIPTALKRHAPSGLIFLIIHPLSFRKAFSN